MASRVATLYITKSISLEELTGSTTIIIDSYDSTRKPLYIRSKRSRAHVNALYINVNELIFPTPLVLSLFLAAASLLLCSFLNVFSVFYIIESVDSIYISSETIGYLPMKNTKQN